MDLKKNIIFFFNKIKIILKENVLDVSCYSVMSAAFMRIWLIDKKTHVVIVVNVVIQQTVCFVHSV